MKCDFCSEIDGKQDHAFNRIYPSVNSRIVYENEQFVALPTIGQIFENSLLILPRKHFQTCAEMPLNFRSKLDLILQEIDERLETKSRIIFEHGARASTGSSCGIYHAHLHYWPIPNELNFRLEEIFPEFENKNEMLSAALNQMHESQDYLCIGSGKKFLTSEVSNLSFKPRSQYFRRRIVEYFNLEQNWDWKDYTAPEPMLLSVIEKMSK